MATTGLLPSVLGDFRSKKQTGEPGASLGGAGSSEPRPSMKGTDPQRSPAALPKIVLIASQSPTRKQTNPPPMTPGQLTNEADSGKHEYAVEDADQSLFTNSMCSGTPCTSSTPPLYRKPHRLEPPDSEEDVEAPRTDYSDLLAELPWSNGGRTESTTATDVANGNGQPSTSRNGNHNTASTGNTCNKFQRKFASTGDLPKDDDIDEILMPVAPSKEVPRKAPMRNLRRCRTSLPDCWPPNSNLANLVMYVFLFSLKINIVSYKLTP